MKLALVSSPRSGNTWFRMLLARMHGLQEHAVHEPGDFDWAQAPDDCIVQMHWHNTDAVREMLSQHGFSMVTISRHPLDVLISILHFCVKEPQTRRWLAGEGGNEADIPGHAPLSDAFLAYALGPRASALLQVTAEWWDQDGVAHVRYEDLVSNTAGTLATLTKSLGPARHDVQAAIDALTMDRLRTTSVNDHFWQGRPGIWRELLTPDVAATIVQAHANVMFTLGYPLDETARADAASADALWRQLA